MNDGVHYECCTLYVVNVLLLEMRSLFGRKLNNHLKKIYFSKKTKSSDMMCECSQGGNVRKSTTMVSNSSPPGWVGVACFRRISAVAYFKSCIVSGNESFIWFMRIESANPLSHAALWHRHRTPLIYKELQMQQLHSAASASQLKGGKKFFKSQTLNPTSCQRL